MNLLLVLVVSAFGGLVFGSGSAILIIQILRDPISALIDTRTPMKTEQIQQLTDTFEAHAQRTDNDVEYWLARDIQHLLGYTEWRNFANTVISKAKTACEISGQATADHFVDVNKMVQLGSDSQREVEDLMLTRYACYLIGIKVPEGLKFNLSDTFIFK